MDDGYIKYILVGYSELETALESVHKKNPQSTINGPPAIPHPLIEKYQM